jgi:lipopolysaccharide transport system ATP-binding protein
MSEVASSGRTVLFVSHNLAAVTALTQRALVLRAGELTFDGPVQAALAHYTSGIGKLAEQQRDWGQGQDSTLVSADLLDEQGNPTNRLVAGASLRLRIVVDVIGIPGVSIEMVLRDELSLPVAFYTSANFNQVSLPVQSGRYECLIALDVGFLASGQYSIDLSTGFANVHQDHFVESAVAFSIESCNPGNAAFNYRQGLGTGGLAMKLARPIEFKPISSPLTG